MSKKYVNVYKLKIGDKIGKSTIINIEKIEDYYLWYFKCDCGKEFTLKSKYDTEIWYGKENISYRNAISCGCNKNNHFEVGQVINRYEIIEFKEYHNKYYYRLRCIKCGKTRQVEEWKLEDAYYRLGKLFCICKKVTCIRFGKIEKDSTYYELYNKWRNMNNRCNNKDCPQYKDYGARGISVCNEWNWKNGEEAWINFKNWSIENGYIPRKERNRDQELDRIDVNGSYEPNNCRFITHKENMRNTRRAKRVNIDGNILTISEWSELTDVGYQSILYQYNKYGEEHTAEYIKKHLKAS